MTTLEVPDARLPRWVENFVARHGEVVDSGSGDRRPGTVHTAADGSWFRIGSYFGAATRLPDDVPQDWGVLVVRKGGFAVARMAKDQIVTSKVGRRHVQGRSKAGGQSQQRFARRRDNQARAAYEAAAEYAVEHFAGLQGPVVVGGDADAIREVLTAAPLKKFTTIDGPRDVDEPRRATLEEFVKRTTSWQVEVENAPGT
ncbi:acVLRF1 family peptidyl-tRNA hydrolase [Nocardioides yefusunii]|uniref:AcVLRF1 family peptidyl-tRNA hydrolase n=1 Tax=Nocardioides yefusunii TaxID=2500546 RepID=A0ABW1QSS2_9ACTN|nr:acVLRF1 family peptidyl-tRNA hydrolase [Nocardioides yefusunii]